MTSIVLLSGEIAAGKTLVAKTLEGEHGFQRVATGSYLKTLAEKRGVQIGRDTLKTIGDLLDIETGGKWVADLASMQSEQNPSANYWLLDSIRRDFQISWFHQVFSLALHVHVTAPEQVRCRRYEERRKTGGEYANATSYEEAKSGPTEHHVQSLAGLCELLIDSEQTHPNGAAEQIMKKLRDLQNNN